MGRIYFNKYEERELLLMDQSDVNLMYSLNDHYLLYLFVQAGRFPPGHQPAPMTA